MYQDYMVTEYTVYVYLFQVYAFKNLKCTRRKNCLNMMFFITITQFLKMPLICNEKARYKSTTATSSHASK